MNVGSEKERKLARKGLWTTPNGFHICITSYDIVISDRNVLNKIQWSYLVLDEAQNIKNYQSKRWQVNVTQGRTKEKFCIVVTSVMTVFLHRCNFSHDCVFASL